MDSATKGNNENNRSKSHRLLMDSIYIAMFAAVIAVCSQIQLPIGPVPFTLQTLGIFTAAGMLGEKKRTQYIYLYSYRCCRYSGICRLQRRIRMYHGSDRRLHHRLSSYCSCNRSYDKSCRKKGMVAYCRHGVRSYTLLCFWYSVVYFCMQSERNCYGHRNCSQLLCYPLPDS